MFWLGRDLKAHLIPTPCPPFGYSQVLSSLGMDFVWILDCRSFVLPLVGALGASPPSPH